MALNQYKEPPWEGAGEARKNSSAGQRQVPTATHLCSGTGAQITAQEPPHRLRSQGAQGHREAMKGDICSALTPFELSAVGAAL